MTSFGLMTDKDKFIALLKEFCIPFKEECVEDLSIHYEITFGYDIYGEFERSPKVTGYVGFFSCWEFDEDGKFVLTGAWE